MNFQSYPVVTPLRVLVVNPLHSASQLTVVKIMSGFVFGTHQLIDLTLLVYSNEMPEAENLKSELYGCGFPCMNSITVSSDLPRLVKFEACPSFSDADVFCFITSFYNPNSVNFNDVDEHQFDGLYLIIKIANSLSCESLPVVAEEPEGKPKKITVMEEKKVYKPIIMADGIVTMNILNYVAKNIPGDMFFCPTALPTIARNILADQIKVGTSDINDILIWAANEEVFHIEVEKPIVKHDRVLVETKCDWDMIGKDRLKALDLDHTQFNETWLKKDYIEKVKVTASKNPYGDIYRASEFSKTLSVVWKARLGEDNGMKVHASVGIISDGSFGTIKGFGYVLPLVFSGETWSVDKRYNESCHVIQELRRINKVVKCHKEKLIPYCEKFLEENIKRQAFVPSDDTDSGYSFGHHSSANQ